MILRDSVYDDLLMPIGLPRVIPQLESSRRITCLGDATSNPHEDTMPPRNGAASRLSLSDLERMIR
jgi:hypothetical protein